MYMFCAFYVTSGGIYKRYVGSNLTNNITLPKNDTTIYDYLEENIEHTMFLGPVDDLEIIRIVQNCKTKRPTDFSNFSLLKKVISKLVKPFAHICNVSFQTGVFPNKMKIPKVIPLYKSGEKTVFFFYKLKANIFITTILKNSGETI